MTNDPKQAQQVAARDTTFDGIVPERLWISSRILDKKYLQIYIEINGIEKEIERIYVGNYDGIHSSSTQLTWIIQKATEEIKRERNELKAENEELNSRSWICYTCGDGLKPLKIVMEIENANKELVEAEAENQKLVDMNQKLVDENERLKEALAKIKGETNDLA